MRIGRINSDMDYGRWEVWRDRSFAILKENQQKKGVFKKRARYGEHGIYFCTAANDITSKQQ